MPKEENFLEVLRKKYKKGKKLTVYQQVMDVSNNEVGPGVANNTLSTRNVPVKMKIVKITKDTDEEIHFTGKIGDEEKEFIATKESLRPVEVSA